MAKDGGEGEEGRDEEKNHNKLLKIKKTLLLLINYNYY